jgi:hypothetical protein
VILRIADLPLRAGRKPALLSRFENGTLRIWEKPRHPPGRVLDHTDRQEQAQSRLGISQGQRLCRPGTKSIGSPPYLGCALWILPQACC